jgi:hypothetical protein
VNEHGTLTDTEGIFLVTFFASLVLRWLVNNIIVNRRDKTRISIFAMSPFDPMDIPFQILFTFWWKRQGPDRSLKLFANVCTVLTILGLVGLLGSSVLRS